MEGDERRSSRKRVLTEKAREGKEQQSKGKKTQKNTVSDGEGSMGTVTNQVDVDEIKLEENVDDGRFVFSRPQNGIETFLRTEDDEEIRLLNLVSCGGKQKEDEEKKLLK